MNNEKAKRRFRKGQLNVSMGAPIRIRGDAGALQSGDGKHVLLADRLAADRQLNQQAVAMCDAGMVALVPVEHVHLDVILMPVGTDEDGKDETSDNQQKFELQFNPVTHADAVRCANEILIDYKDRKITSFDEVEGRILKSPIPSMTRELVATAKETWPATQTELGPIVWEGLNGISEPLRCRKPVLLEGLVVAVISDRLTVHLKLTRCLTPEHTDSVESSNGKSVDRLVLGYASRSVGRQFAALQGLDDEAPIPVRLAATVKKALTRGMRPEFTVTAVYAWPETPEQLQRAIEKLNKDILRKPPASGPWKDLS